ncbi:MAG: hypothetical protein H8D23_11075 [Candidatus Brocadiales bacterium]|nr:hypothetical protein [Candidatus Brocadiales bacterium]
MAKITDVDFSKITRVTVVSETEGRMIEKWDVSVYAMLQDDDRTLKIFMKDRPQKGKEG